MSVVYDDEIISKNVEVSEIGEKTTLKTKKIYKNGTIFYCWTIKFNGVGVQFVDDKNDEKMDGKLTEFMSCNDKHELENMVKNFEFFNR